jgi:uncharacterized protein YbaR (Trm112 family)
MDDTRCYQEDMLVHPDLAEILRCPKCRGKVVEQKLKQGEGLACEACRLLYPIIDDIPNFLVEDARPLE